MSNYIFIMNEDASPIDLPAATQILRRICGPASPTMVKCEDEARGYIRRIDDGREIFVTIAANGKDISIDSSGVIGLDLAVQIAAEYRQWKGQAMRLLDADYNYDIILDCDANASEITQLIERPGWSNQGVIFASQLLSKHSRECPVDAAIVGER